MAAYVDDQKGWQLRSDSAALHVDQLALQVDLCRPDRGLQQITWRDVALEGDLLGVSTGAAEDTPPAHPSDRFVRGNDLVATYAETGEQPFSLQVYWRVNAAEIWFDTILSLQTPLLESFPAVGTRSRLGGDEVWRVPGDGSSPEQLSDLAAPQWCDGGDCVVVRAGGGSWSYAELTPPGQGGAWQVRRAAQDPYLIERNLGGAFLEKGVLRRLRVRGALLPREHDLELASQCLAALAAEGPPLTV